LETEEKYIALPFLDILVTGRLDGTLGQTVYRKPTHMDVYLHTIYKHHPAQKQAVQTALV
jgi:hypothetical protein